jgi:hypothetical protein
MVVGSVGFCKRSPVREPDLGHVEETHLDVLRKHAAVTRHRGPDVAVPVVTAKQR